MRKTIRHVIFLLQSRVLKQPPPPTPYPPKNEFMTRHFLTRISYEEFSRTDEIIKFYEEQRG